MVLLAVQTGLRLSEITGLHQNDVVLWRAAHVRCEGKGRKERCTPLAKPTVAVLKAWINEQGINQSGFLFPNRNGGRLSADAVQHALGRHATAAQRKCPSLAKKRVTPHVLRHTAAMELLQAGVDRALIAIWLGHESLDTTQMSEVSGVGDFQAVLKQSVVADFSYGQFRFLNLDALIASKKAVGRDRDLSAVRSLLAIKERNEQQGQRF